MTNITAKLAFLHAAHEFALHPSPTNERTLLTAMRMHQDAVYPCVAVQITRHPDYVPNDSTEQEAFLDASGRERARFAIGEIQALEAERLGPARHPCWTDTFAPFHQEKKP